MSKFVIILLVAAFAACINADDNSDDFVSKFVNSGRTMWDTGVMQPIDQAMDMGEKAIKDLQPIANGMSSGSFKSFEHHTEMKDGQVVSDGGSSKTVTNKNGVVKETSSTE